MSEQDLRDINWRAVLIGFGVDWAFTELVGAVAVIAALLLKGVRLDADTPVPADVQLTAQFVGVLGAVVGGLAAGYVAGRRGTVHALLGSLVGLALSFCLYGLARDVGDLGFVVLNLVGAGYGGGLGERWRARREEAE